MTGFDCTNGTKSSDPMQPLVAMIGTSLQFSDQILRVLRLEFAGVHFDRLGDPRALLELDACPNVVIVHEALPGLEERIREIQRDMPKTLVAIACNDASVFQQANQRDSFPPVSVLQMNSQLDVWFSVLRLLLCGQVYVPIEVLRAPRKEAEVDASAALDRAADVQLTPREMEILPLIAQGKQNKMIAGELGLSEHTVKLHTHNIFAKLRVSNRTGAANWYLSQLEGSRNVGNDVFTK